MKGVIRLTVVEDPVITMKRYEMKYIITPEQEKRLIEGMSGRLHVDDFGKTTIETMYYDTPDRRLIYHSMEGGEFKEKIRLRSYGLATDTSPVFLELKRKVENVVYKRRIETTIPDAERFLRGEYDHLQGEQITRELIYFHGFYGKLEPVCLIIYDRTAYIGQDADLRLTIDNDPRFRKDDLDLRVSLEGESLFPRGYSVLEIKVQNSLPLWLSALLDKEKIYKTSFSKYREAFKRINRFSTGGIV